MVDVLFFCEGTYPYVSGGVSSWIHQLITGLPDLKFGIVYLATSESEPKTLRYQLPDNLVQLVEFYLYDYVEFELPTTGASDRAWRDVAPFLQGLFAGESREFERAFPHVSASRQGLPSLSFADLARSEASWDLLLEVYREKFPQASFTDFFWSWRYAHYPLYKLFSAAIPAARVYHTVTTGWCGLLGALAARRYERPMLVTEHGLYVNERRIEISQADWIYVDAPSRGALAVGLGTFKELWINLFLALGRACYQQAERIYTLFEGNRERQIEFGAPPEKIEVVPNGVDVEALEAVTERALAKDPSKFRVGFVGRVVPIKDVKTLLKAARMAAQSIPGLEVYLCGPTDEDPDYAAECRALVEVLDLGSVVRFLGMVNARTYYPCFDVQVLTSISEGQPLVILEGFCSGLPCVATDVGACQELILGRPGADRDLGPAGMVTWVGNARQTAEALITLHGDPALRASMASAARARVKRYYDQRELLKAYRQVYREAMAR